MSKNLILLLSLIILMYSCNKSEPITTKSEKNYIQYVDPLIGTGEMGHVFPGATAPFGMVQLSPQTNFEPMHLQDGSYNKKTYDYCSGYQYKDSTILGFAHTQFSGTGHSDLGDILIIPVGKELSSNDFENIYDFSKFASKFSHKNEVAQPGFYSVLLEKDNIKAKLTCTERVGFHNYSFNSDKASILLDMVYNVYHHEDKNVWTFLRVEDDTTVVGYRQTQGWGRTRLVYFAINFSVPISDYGYKKFDNTNYNGFYRRFNESANFPEMAGKNLKAFFNFDLKNQKELKIKVALSSVSTKGALNNLKTEIPHWDFEKTKTQTQNSWNVELGKIDAKFKNDSDLKNFYTALYHTYLSPIIYQDVDKKYRGLDQNIYSADNFDNYTIFSLWDTYRALHPLFNIIQPTRNINMVKSMLAHQEQSVHKMLPIWSHYANENWCMIGYHAASVIADAIVKNPKKIDVNKALEACVKTANVEYFDGLGDYIKYNYVPDDKSHSSVSKTLELSYDDWCIAQIAKIDGNKDIEAEFLKRSENYNNVFDKTIGFMRPKLSDGSFRVNFDPLDTHGQGFIEGNSWNYGLYVPQNTPKLIELIGGNDKFINYLDSLFNMNLDEKYFAENEDITHHGIMGGYVHGNEPSHHIPYLYNWTNQPYKTQKTVRDILKNMYKPTFDGLCGNDDCGQMSAWYIFSALGFYPVLPGSDAYTIGSPLVESCKINIENGKTFYIIVKNQSDENIYVKNIKYNGKIIENYTLLHNQIVNGGTLEFEMSNLPKK